MAKQSIESSRMDLIVVQCFSLSIILFHPAETSPLETMLRRKEAWIIANAAWSIAKQGIGFSRTRFSVKKKGKRAAYGFVA